MFRKTKNDVHLTATETNDIVTAMFWMWSGHMAAFVAF